MKKYKFILSILVLFMIVGCSIQPLTNTEKYGTKGYLIAKNEITNLAEQYETAYQSASPIAQLNWKNNIDPLFLQADQILKDWKIALDIGGETSTNYDKYILIRKAILNYLVEIEKG